MKKIKYVALVIVIVILVISSIALFKFTQKVDVSVCYHDSECIIVDSIEGLQYIPDIFDECGCITAAAINSKHIDLWKQKKEEFKGKLKCTVLCKLMPKKEDYVTKCINNKCVLQFKKY